MPNDCNEQQYICASVSSAQAHTACGIQEDANADDTGAYDEVDDLYDEALLDALTGLHDLAAPGAAAPAAEGAAAAVPAAAPAVEKGSKGKKGALSEGERARAEAEKAKEREKQQIASVRAQLAAKGCGLRERACLREAASGPRRCYKSVACIVLLAIAADCPWTTTHLTADFE